MSSRKGSETEGAGHSRHSKKSKASGKGGSDGRGGGRSGGGGGRSGGRGGGRGGSTGDVGRALRSVYDDTLREPVPDDFLNLIGKLS